jgi:hypothetical protein
MARGIAHAISVVSARRRLPKNDGGLAERDGPWALLSPATQSDYDAHDGQTG